VTYTGDGSYTRSISHSLGSTPGCVIIKRTNGTGDWYVWHRSIDPTYTLYLNGTNASSPIGVNWSPSSTTFTATTQNTTNNSGYTYVAYLFAHNAGGFGATGSDNVITCGSYVGNNTPGNTVTLGYEPQLVLIKNASDFGTEWILEDVMRQMDRTNSNFLSPNSSAAESSAGMATIVPTATGFFLNNSGGGDFNYGGSTYIYIAIRLGPMKVPTVGTSVFAPVYQAGGGTVTTNFRADMTITKDVAVAAVGDNFVWDRLRGSADGSLQANNLKTNSASSESSGSFSAAVMNVSNVAVKDSFYGSGYNIIYWNFQRAPGFMDVVCYTGTGSATTVPHNLGAVPQWIIVKRRSGTEGGFGVGDWYVYSSALGNDYFVALNGADSKSNSGLWNYTSPTSSVFSVGTFFTNYSGDKYVAYLFATVAGVSKVGSYTGTGAARTIDCGFTTGARFVLIRQTANGGGSWYLWDSARGISSSNDPYILLNSAGAQVSGTNYVDTASVGFQITSAATAADINTLYAPYIFLAIA